MGNKEIIYEAAPFFIKRLFANAEAFRRNYYRHSKGYNNLLNSFLKNNPLVTGIDDSIINEKLNNIISWAKNNIDYYDNYDYNSIQIDNLAKLPLLKKDDIRNSKNDIKNKNAGAKELQKGITSGSTGTPVSYYTDKNSLTHSRAYLDSFKSMQGLKKGMNSARISGIRVVPLERGRPPYWLYIDVFKQLQCSVLHIDKNTVSDYFKAFDKYCIKHGNGYATGWLFLAQAASQAGISTPKFESIITDSEGLSPAEQDFVESAFGCRVSQTYGLSEVDTIAVMCPERNYHIFPGRCVVEITDDSGNPLPNGSEGNIVITDLNSHNFPYIRYVTGDLGIKGESDCKCGWKSPYLSSVVGRVDDYILKKDGRKIRRLGHIMAPAKDIIKSQLIQTDYDTLLIKIVPDKGFRDAVMEDIIKNAANYLGDMKISWELTNELKRTDSGKIKYIIRDIGKCQK